MPSSQMELSLKKLKNIFLGTYRNIFNEKEDLAKQRYKICITCSHNKFYKGFAICDLCGCILNSKIRVDDEICPENKWKDINNNLNDNDL